MYDRDVVDLALYALEEGRAVAEAARIAGAGATAVRRWRDGHLPHQRGEGSERQRAAASASAARRREAMGTYDPPASGPLSGLTPDQIENMLLRAVLADLKAAGWDPASISNRRKRGPGERLRRETGLPLRSVTAFLRMSKSSYEHRRARLGRPPKHGALSEEVERVFREEGRSARGYRFVHARLARGGTRVSEKVVRRLMRERGLRPAYARRGRRYSSYAGETDDAPPNLPLREDGTHDFRAAAPNEKWVSDITEFRLPGDAGKACLSPVIDLFDGRPAGWSVGTSPDADLANSSLRKACAQLAEGEAPLARTDRGCHYRWPGWKAVCAERGLTRSMSRKGCSPDNAAAEGFFGRLKNEFFYGRDWAGVTAEQFMRRLDGWMRFYCSGRLRAFREDGRIVWDTIDGRRRRLGLMA